MISRILKVFLFLIYCTNALYDSNSKVVNLTAKDFKKLVLDSDDLWMVEFYAPWCGHCKSLAPEYNKAALALSGIVKIGAVDMTKEQSVGSPYGIKGYPTLKFFGGNKKSPKDYNGQRTADAISNFCMDEARSVMRDRLSGKSSTTKKPEPKKPEPKKPNTDKKESGNPKKGEGKVIELTESSFNSDVLKSDDLWFVLFYAPWCGHCKSLMPDWTLAAAETDKIVHFGKLDCTAHQSVCSNYSVQGYPTMKFFKGGVPEDYNGGRSKSDLVGFANLKGESHKPPKELKELVDQSVYNDYCVESDGLCLIAFLPHIKDSGEDKRKEYIQELEDLKNKNKGTPVSFLWVQGGDNYDFEEALNLGFGFPCVVAIHTGKGKFSIMRSTYSKDNINKFIGDLWRGKSSLYNLRSEMPKIKKKKVTTEKVTTEL
jgi:protein disulfide-isomerase A6